MDEAIALLRGLFPDEGRALLAEGGLGPDWADALAYVPDDVLGWDEAEPGPSLLASLRDFWSRQHDVRPALAATRALLRLRASALGNDHPDTLVELAALGALAERAGRVEEGGELLHKAWRALNQLLPGDDLRVAVVAGNLARHLVRQERWSEAEEVLARGHRIRLRLAPATTGPVAAQLAEVRLRLGQEREALPLLREAVTRYTADFGAEHPGTIARVRTLGGVLNRLGMHREAVEALRSVWPLLQGDPEAVAATSFELGVGLWKLGQRDEGLRRLDEALRWTRAARDPEGLPHPALPARLTARVHAALERGNTVEAEGLMREALEVERRLHGEVSLPVAERYAALGRYAAQARRPEEALGWLDVAASAYRRVVGDADPRTRRTVEELAAMLLAEAEAAVKRRDRDGAAHLLARGFALAEPVLGFSSERTRKLRAALDALRR